MARHLVFCVLVFLATVGTSLGLQVPTMVIRNVTVVDVVTGKLRRNVSVAITGKRISSVRPHTTTSKATTVIDGTGKFLIPGMWDMHVHYFNNFSRIGTDNQDSYGRLFLANGITGIRDMASDFEDRTKAKIWAAELASGAAGPRVVIGSNIIDGDPPFAPGMYPVKKAEGARAAVRLMKAQGATFIKVYWNLSPDTYAAIADESKKLGIPFAGHVPFQVSAFTASSSGQKSIEHLTGISETCTSKEDELRKKEWTLEVEKEILSTFDIKKCRRLFKMYAQNGTYNVPTMVLHRGMLKYDDPSFRARPALAFISATEIKEWDDSPQLNKILTPEERIKHFTEILDLVREMNNAGVPLMAGTDNNNPFVVPGFDLHDELELFTKAGMTPIEALRTATMNPAKYLGATDRYGRIKGGIAADLVLLDADPTIDIKNTRRIFAVVSNGNFLDRAGLDAILTNAKTHPRK